MNSMASYSWPGNIRELQNVIERAVILSKGSELKISLTGLAAKPPSTNRYANGEATLEEVERKHILSVLEQTNWVFAGPKGAAAQLGMKRPTLQFRMRKLGITRPPKPWIEFLKIGLQNGVPKIWHSANTWAPLPIPSFGFDSDYTEMSALVPYEIQAWGLQARQMCDWESMMKFVSEGALTDKGNVRDE
jgi:hypothetical protein